MTSAQLKTQIDAAITNKVAADSITPTDVGNNLKAIVDYIDQEVVLKATDANVVHKTGIETITGLKVFENQIGFDSIQINNDFNSKGLAIVQNASGLGLEIKANNNSTGMSLEINDNASGLSIINNNLTGNCINLLQDGTEASISIQNGTNSTGIDIIADDGDCISLTSTGAGKGISIFNSGVGPAIDISNAASITGISINNIGSGSGMNIINSGVEPGLEMTNSGNGSGIEITSTGNGSGLVVVNNGTNSSILVQGNGGILVSNEGTGISLTGTATSSPRLITTTISASNAANINTESAGFGAYITSSSTGIPLVVDAVVPGATLKLFSGKNQGVETSYITKTGSFNGTAFNVIALQAEPASAVDTGTLGEFRITANYIYICTALNTWKRVAISTF